MGTLPSGLITIDLGTEGWDAIFNLDMELLDEKLESVMNGNKDLGVGTVAANTNTVTAAQAQQSAAVTDSTTGTAGLTINDVGATFSQSALNDNFASIAAQLNHHTTEVADVLARTGEEKTFLEGLQTTLNNLLTELRKSTGNGVLGG